MGAPIPKVEPVDNSTAEALLSSLETVAPTERRKHASIFNYWLSIRGDRQFPPIRDLDPLELSDAGPWSVLLELIGAGENAVIRHLGQAIKLGIEAETIARAPDPSLLSCIHARLPTVASSLQPLAFEDEFETEGGTSRCWVTLLPFSANGTWIDYVYGFVSLDAGGAAEVEQQPAEEALESFQVPLRPLDGDPGTAETEMSGLDEMPEVAEQEPEPEASIEPEMIEQPSEPEPEAEPLPAMEAAFEPEAPEPEPVPELVLEEPVVEPVAEENEPEAWPEPEAVVQAVEPEPEPEPASAADYPPGKPGFSARFFESLASVGGFYGKVVEAPEPVVTGAILSEPVCEVEGSLQSKLSEVRAKADEARAAKIRANAALYEGLSAAYDFALDAENSPEEYLRLVEAEGLKIQLRSPMKPVVKLAFSDLCDDATIKQLEAILAWAFDEELPRGTLAERIEAQGGLGPILEGLSRAA